MPTPTVRPRRTAPSRAAAAVLVRRPDQAVWSRALVLAAGDVTRLTVEADGTVVVANAGARRP